MTGSVQLASALPVLVSLLLLLLVVKLWKSALVDWYRQEMFALRDDLFITAAEGLIPFDHPAYGTLRSTMNGFIRRAHLLSFTQTMIVAVCLGGSMRHGAQDTFEERFEKHLVGLPEPVADKLRNYFYRVNVMLVKHVVLTSPVFWVTILPVLVALFAQESLFRLALRIPPGRSRIDEMDTWALVHGEASAQRA